MRPIDTRAQAGFTADRSGAIPTTTEGDATTTDSTNNAPGFFDPNADEESNLYRAAAAGDRRAFTVRFAHCFYCGTPMGSRQTRCPFCNKNQPTNNGSASADRERG